MHSVTNEANRLFEEIALCLQHSAVPQKDYLLNLKPLIVEYELEEWRYRLSGYLECLLTSEHMSLPDYERFIVALFGTNKTRHSKPTSNVKAFNIKVLDKQHVPFNYDVPAVNPLDAYYQLSKRIEYRTITDILRVEIYNGMHSGRGREEKPIHVYLRDMLMYP